MNENVEQQGIDYEARRRRKAKGFTLPSELNLELVENLQSGLSEMRQIILKSKEGKE